jgi:hypothetical protein
MGKLLKYLSVIYTRLFNFIIYFTLSLKYFFQYFHNTNTYLLIFIHFLYVLILLKFLLHFYFYK